MEPSGKRVLLIDFDDSRRRSRILLLESVGHEVETRLDYVGAEKLDHEGTYDLIIVALHTDPERTVDYSDRLVHAYAGLPILLLTDDGVFTPRGTLNPSLASGQPKELMKQVASMLGGSTFIREIPLNQ